ncbi:MAG: 4Fe-4S binding protein [Syntrophorhabdaceae bacterium]|nr:4Fe-4S binding protein [Syntrophorhabdales bacterium]MBP9561720.1 4Fe-4S binding protein [Syntrophorhabdaceae bacterium]
MIDLDKCNGCGDCLIICPYDVFKLLDKKIIVSSPEDCIECLSCLKECHKKAIYMGD